MVQASVTCRPGKIIISQSGFLVRLSDAAVWLEGALAKIARERLTIAASFSQGGQARNPIAIGIGADADFDFDFGMGPAL